MEAGVIVGVEEAERGVVVVVAVAEGEEVEGAVRETVHGWLFLHRRVS